MTLAPSLPSTPAPARIPFVADLERFGDRVALRTSGTAMTYRELAAAADGAGALLGGGRRLVLVAAHNALDAVVAYVGALRAGHVPFLVPASAPLDDIVAAYDPDSVVEPEGGVWRTRQRRPEAAHELHPDLGLLLSTSGTTGSPKAVRLSRENVQANAESIVEALGLTGDDRAVTTLPFHYSYGLSVLHTHLLVGGEVVLTDLSVVDPCFWQLVERARPTTLAGVPHTFDLLERVGFPDGLRGTSLRQVTQAGGRMDPERVRDWAWAGQRSGFDFVVMYGQTEATARMAVLPPALVSQVPDAVGYAVPGGAFRVENAGACGSGDLVYAGANVMLGYATGPDDLARGREVDDLRTGDVARITPDGLVRIVGRRSRFAKVVGLRIDLDRVPDLVRAVGVAGVRDVEAVDLDGRIGVLVAAAAGTDARLDRDLAARLGVPASAVEVRTTSEIPRLPTGKPDLGAVRALFTAPGAPQPVAPAPSAPVSAPDRAARVLAVYRRLLDRPDAGPEDTFVGLGGDSLSYVEVSLHLERVLGDLPDGWHLRTVRDLADAPAPKERGRLSLRRVETSVVLRAVAIVLVLVTHTGIAGLQGGAHVLLALAGFNLARFHLGDAPRRERLRRIARGVGRVTLPAVAWIGAVALVTAQYEPSTVLLVNQVLGDRSGWSDQWSFWFVESLAYLLVGAGALLAVPAVDRWQRRFPWLFPMALVAVGLLTRYAVLVPDAGRMRGGTAYVVLWLFALGWAGAAARTRWQRLAVSAVVVATVPGFWPTQPLRELIVVAGVLLLVWVPTVRVPAVVARVSGVVAAASLYIYVTHWQVYPVLRTVDPWLAVAASVAVGLVYWRLVGVVTGRWRGARLSRRRGRGSPARRAS